MSSTLQWKKSNEFNGETAWDTKDDTGGFYSWDIHIDGDRVKLYHTTHDYGPYQYYKGTYSTIDEAKTHAD